MDNGKQIPRHVAIIMDGNGRWAKKQAKPRVFGHQEGADRLQEVMEAAQKIGVSYLTLYAFSKENWQRPQEEIRFLMELLSKYLDHKLQDLKKNNVVFNTIGDLKDMPVVVQSKLAKAQEETANNTGLVVTFALSYSSRFEITNACKQIAQKVQEGVFKVGDIDENLLSQYLYTKDIPDPDLLIRTSGEFRISNFLLWQISYSEIYFTEKYWPEFSAAEFQKAIVNYQKRERRYGRTEPAKVS
jgi:undecaprenyl diphosphate synthase